MEEKQFNILCKKIDKLSGIIISQNLDDRDKKVYVLKQSGLNSKEIGDFIGLAESSVRTSKGWKKK
ncbi:hypothetical protein HQ533_06055 [Candidatus Woesearchaeota archaeon]|nr:hypothetical protein [Candidatus Woesearchaeota archaeon]